MSISQNEKQDIVARTMEKTIELLDENGYFLTKEDIEENVSHYLEGKEVLDSDRHEELLEYEEMAANSEKAEMVANIVSTGEYTQDDEQQLMSRSMEALEGLMEGIKARQSNANHTFQRGAEADMAGNVDSGGWKSTDEIEDDIE